MYSVSAGFRLCEALIHALTFERSSPHFKKNILWAQKLIACYTFLDKISRNYITRGDIIDIAKLAIKIADNIG